MDYKISYSFFSIRGRVRSRHEDNLFADGFILPRGNDGMEEVKTGECSSRVYPLLCVFDGMGGETAGDEAAFLAAHRMRELWQEERHEQQEGGPQPGAGIAEKAGHRDACGNCRDYLADMCFQMNRDVCGYASKNRIRTMGTTMAGLFFAPQMICSVNVGDSRIYRSDRRGLAQLSTDHVARSCFSRKGPLTQFIGIPEKEMVISPAIEEEKVRRNSQYLICTDGVTDMVPEDMLHRIMRSRGGLWEKAERIREEVLRQGAVDNATAVLCSIAF